MKIQETTPGILPCGVSAMTDHKFRFPSPSRSEFCFPRQTVFTGGVGESDTDTNEIPKE